MLFFAMLTLTAPIGDAANLSKRDIDRRNAALIQRVYPLRAKEAGEEGQVGFRVRIDSKGRPIGCRVTRTSGFPRLDRETCEVILSKAAFGKTYDQQGRAIATTSDGVISWVLSDRDFRHADVTKQIRTSTITDGEEITCEFTTKPGTLGVKVKLCLTQREWNLTHSLARGELNRMILGSISND